MKTHGMSKTRFYNIWMGMIKRCRNKKSSRYRYYGKRGIQIKWKSFEEFRDDMYAPYLSHVAEYGEKNTEIERINNDGNYSKKNCKWATHREQILNRNFNCSGEKNAFFNKKHTEKTKQTIGEKNSKNWLIIDPNGKKFKVKNLSKFLREILKVSNNHVWLTSLCSVAAGRKEHFKGWKCKIIN